MNLIQSNSNFANVGTTVTMSLPSASTAGNTYLAYASCLGAQATLTIQDTVNGVYQTDVTNGGLGPNTAVIARFSIIGNGTPSFILNSTAAGSGVRLAIQEWGGLDIPPVLDQYAGGAFSSGGTTTPTSGTTNTLSSTGELVVMYGVTTNNTTWAAGGSFQLDPNLSFANATRGIQFLTAGGTGAQSGSFTISPVAQPWNVLIATYLPFTQPSNDSMSGQFWI